MMKENRRVPIVTLITDYGWKDYYVGATKGIILGIAPQTTLVDVTHEIEPRRIADAAFVLRHIFPCFPAGTVHLAIVDPGVGTPRRILVGQYAGQFVVAPDNGTLSWVHRDFGKEALYAVESKQYFRPWPSATFHGRDIMAPVAAHVVKGTPLAEFGPAVEQVELLDFSRRGQVDGRTIRGQVIYVDRFGNLVTNIHETQLKVDLTASAQPFSSAEVFVDNTSVGPIRQTFADVPWGETVAYVGSVGFLEIAVNHGSAAQQFVSKKPRVIEVRSVPPR